VIYVNPDRAWFLLNVAGVVLLIVLFTAANIFKPCMMPLYVSLPPHPVWFSTGVAFILLGVAMKRVGSQYLAYHRGELGVYYASKRFRVRQTYVMVIYIGSVCVALGFGAYYAFIASLTIIPLIIATLFYEVVSRLARRD
jgi:hypothetical protein